jgi:Schlafen, AlbA_2
MTSAGFDELRRRVLLFSLGSASFGLMLGAIIFCFTNLYVPLDELHERNRGTLGRIQCGPQACDVAEIANDWEFAASDYVVDKDTNFLLNLDVPEGDFSDFALHRSDPAFISRFQAPSSVSTPAGESWRLSSAMKQVGNRRVAVMVGYAEKASWKMDVPASSRLIDANLKEQLAKIQDSLREEGGKVELPSSAQRKVTDGYEVVDLDTDRILSGGYWLPVFLPPHNPVPREGPSFYRDKTRLYVVRTDSNERLLAASMQSIGDVPSIAALFGLLFAVTGMVAYVSGTTFLRKYFLFSQTRSHTVEEALKLGEGESIEFKRSISIDSASSVEQILQTVAAFANSGDGTIFIGIEDEGQIKGVPAAGPKGRDQLSQRIYQLVRQRIRPTPSIRVDFADVRGYTVCTLFVPRGEEPLHFLDGVIYLRYGSSDIKAQPEMVKRLLAAHAF